MGGAISRKVGSLAHPTKLSSVSATENPTISTNITNTDDELNFEEEILQSNRDEWNRPRIHLPARPFCQVCHGKLKASEYVVALLSNTNTTAYNGCTLPFQYPTASIRHVVSKTQEQYTLCCKNKCTFCNGGPEGYMVHTECLRIFQRTSENMEYIWTRAAWIQPFQNAPRLDKHLPEVDIDPQVIYDGAARLGLPGMRLLPVELIWQIREFSDNSQHWRSAAALSCANSSLKDNTPNVLQRRLVKDVKSWQRGASIQTRELPPEGPGPQLVRLGIDGWRIKYIERICEPKTPIDVDTPWYIVEDAREFDEVSCESKAGLLRLRLPPGHKGYRVWDTPFPPPWQLSSWVAASSQASVYIRTIDLKQSTGLTFLYWRNDLQEIHNHTRKSPRAIGFSRSQYEDHVLVYVPLFECQPLRRIRVLWDSRSKQCCDVQLFTKMGQISPTSLLPERAMLNHLNVEFPTTLMSQHLKDEDHITTLGAYSDGTTNPSSPCVRIPMYAPPTERLLSHDIGHFSSASLEEVSSVTMFYDVLHSYCKGILLCYADGAQRALGQCGIGIFPEKRISSPQMIYYRNCEPKRNPLMEHLLVEFSTDDTPSEDWADWQGRPMVGKVEWWFNYRATVLRFDFDTLR